MAYCIRNQLFASSTALPRGVVPPDGRSKSLGAKWDATVTSWYVPEGLDTRPFAAWLSGSLALAVAPAAALAVIEGPSVAGTELAVVRSGVPLSRLLAGVSSAVAAEYRSGVWTTVEVTEVKFEVGTLPSAMAAGPW